MIAPTYSAVGWVTALVEQATAAGSDVRELLQLARDDGARLPLPGGGETAQRWRILTELAPANLSAARVFEAHTDALAILAEAGERAPEGAYGVFAAEAPGCRLKAEECGGQFRLTGTKPWCSLGSAARLGPGHRAHRRRTSAIPGRPATTARRGRANDRLGRPRAAHGHEHLAHLHWHPSARRSATSTGTCTDRAFRGAVSAWLHAGTAGRSVCRTDCASPRPIATTISPHLSVGRVDATLHAAAATLEGAAAAIDRGAADGPAGELLAPRVRAVVADAAERTLREVAHALGPAPLAFEEGHARRVADLELYVRQHHGERDLATLGRVALMAIDAVSPILRFARRPEPTSGAWTRSWPPTACRRSSSRTSARSAARRRRAPGR